MDWRGRLQSHLDRRYAHLGLTVDDLTISNVSGYWQINRLCGGFGVCRNEIHRTLGNEGPMHHTIFYADPSRDAGGRFAARYRTWNEAKAE